MGKFMVLFVTSRKTSSKGFDFTDLYNNWISFSTLIIKKNVLKQQGNGELVEWGIIWITKCRNIGHESANGSTFVNIQKEQQKLGGPCKKNKGKHQRNHCKLGKYLVEAG